MATQKNTHTEKRLHFKLMDTRVEHINQLELWVCSGHLPHHLPALSVVGQVPAAARHHGSTLSIADYTKWKNKDHRSTRCNNVIDWYCWKTWLRQWEWVICLPSASGPWCFQRCFPYLQSPAPPSQRAHRSHPWFWPAAHSAGGPLDWGLSCWRPTTQGTSRVNCILMSGTWRRNYRVRCKGMQTFAVISFKDG